jgi:hypothetical protein
VCVIRLVWFAWFFYFVFQNLFGAVFFVFFKPPVSTSGGRQMSKKRRQEDDDEKMQKLVDENKELFRLNVELGMEATRLKRKLDKAKGALRAELEKRDGEPKQHGTSPVGPKRTWLFMYYADCQLDKDAFKATGLKHAVEDMVTLQLMIDRKGDQHRYVSLIKLSCDLEYVCLANALRMLVHTGALPLTSSVALQSWNPREKHEYLDIPTLENWAVGFSKSEVIRYLNAWGESNVHVWRQLGGVLFPFQQLHA